MYVELRYYKRFDPDLIALYESGINFNDYLPDIIMAYTKGWEYHLLVPFCPACDLDERKLIHTRVRIRDPASIELLKKVKIGYRNTFCKLLIRNALVRQSFGVFFSDPFLIEKENISVSSINQDRMENMVTAVIRKGNIHKRKKITDEPDLKPKGITKPISVLEDRKGILAENENSRIIGSNEIMPETEQKSAEKKIQKKDEKSKLINYISAYLEGKNE